MEETSNQQFEKSKVRNQYLAGIAACFAWIAAGFSIGYTSPALPSMQKDKIVVEKDILKAWIGSLMPLGGFFGGLIAGTLTYTFGRRLTLLIFCSSIFSCGFLAIGVTKNIGLILTGRFLCGVSCGVTSCVVPPYIAEITQPHVRGKVSVFPQLAITIGIMTIYIVGTPLKWDALSFFCLCAPFLLVIGMTFCPESPMWLLSRGKEDKARQSLLWLRGSKYDAGSEIKEIQEHLELSKQETGTFKDLLTTWTLRPLVISLILMFFQQAGGINAVMFYTVDIFNMSKSTIQENVATIIIGVVQVVATGASVFLIDRLGRKVLLLISSALQAVSLCGLGTYFFTNASRDKTSFGFVPLVCLMVFIIGFSVGFGPIPWVLLGELFPTAVKNKAASISSSFNWLMAFVISNVFVPLLNVFTAAGVFLLFAVMNILAFVFCFFIVPETKYKKLEEIEREFRARKKKKDTDLGKYQCIQ